MKRKLLVMSLMLIMLIMTSTTVFAAGTLNTNNSIREVVSADYSGDLASEIHQFVAEIIPSGVSQEQHDEADRKEDKYSSLTNKEKKEICEYIESRYEYYDNLNGGYSGDKYSDTIMEEAANKYGLTVTQIEIIWMNMYSYG